MASSKKDYVKYINQLDDLSNTNPMQDNYQVQEYLQQSVEILRAELADILLEEVFGERE